MSRRERIIVVAMALALLYGGYQILAPKDKAPRVRKSSKAGKSLTPFAADVVGRMKKLDSTPFDAYVVARGNSKWPANPFFQGEIRHQEKEKPNSPSLEGVESRLKLSGFLRIGDKNFAVINGTEYQVGEILVEYGCRVESIGPKQVVLAPMEGAGTITLTMDGMDE